MESIDFWKLCDQLTVEHAGLLVAGYNPSEHIYVENQSVELQPMGYYGARHAVLSGLKSKKIEGTVHRKYSSQDDNEGYICVRQSVVDVESLKAWLLSKNVTRHFFFFPVVQVSEFLNNDHLRYSAKLAAAVTAWNWLDDEAKLEGKTPKQAVQKWLRKHAAEYGICDDDGKPNESVVTGISQIVNWQTKGGAPRTPTKKVASDKSTGPKAQMSVPDPSPASMQSYEMDDDIPF
jgi:hypothetical protein